LREEINEDIEEIHEQIMAFDKQIKEMLNN